MKCHRWSSDEFIQRPSRSLLVQVVRCVPVTLRHGPSSFIVRAFGGGGPPTMPSADFSTVFSVRFQMPSFVLPKHQRDLPG